MSSVEITEPTESFKPLEGEEKEEPGKEWPDLYPDEESTKKAVFAALDQLQENSNRGARLASLATAGVKIPDDRNGEESSQEYWTRVLAAQNIANEKKFWRDVAWGLVGQEPGQISDEDALGAIALGLKMNNRKDREDKPAEGVESET